MALQQQQQEEEDRQSIMKSWVTIRISIPELVSSLQTRRTLDQVEASGGRI
jgi:hypothetical protein